MRRQELINSIEKRLSLLNSRLELRGRLNILDLNLHSENFFLHFLNLLYGWKLENLNLTKSNVAAIDLIDHEQKLIVQVSASATKQKLDNTMKKITSPQYEGHTLKFIPICNNADQLKARNYHPPLNITFNAHNDILDLCSILKTISVKDISELEEIQHFIRNEIQLEPDPQKIESNLTGIIKILAKENWSENSSPPQTTPYDITEKISYNGLRTTVPLIDDYKIHYARLDKIYSEFDKLGTNKSASILNRLRCEYIKIGNSGCPDSTFLKVVEVVKQIITTSSNYSTIPDEELSLCVEILVVDAFIRCKIFKKPEN